MTLPSTVRLGSVVVVLTARWLGLRLSGSREMVRRVGFRYRRSRSSAFQRTSTMEPGLGGSARVTATRSPGWRPAASRLSSQTKAKKDG